MINKNSLVINCSRPYIVNEKQVFNVHIEDYSDLSKYIFADILLPDYQIQDSNLFSQDDLSALITYCKEHYDVLLSMSINESQKEPITDDSI